jgi:hypothetical protein
VIVGVVDDARLRLRQRSDFGRINMTTITRRALAIAAFALTFSASMAAAQAPVRVRGTIESIDASGIVVVKGRDGKMMKVKLADNAPVRSVVKRTLADIKPGSYLGITAMPQPDGSQKAVEIHIFPEAMRGVGEGHTPWDLKPNSTMTNATVGSEVASKDGQVLMMKYKGGEKKIVVPADAAIVTYGPGSKADLKPGAGVFVFNAKKLPDDTLEAPNITVGKNGVNPPM